MKNLTEKAVLVKLALSKWSGWKYDRKASREVADNKDANSNLVRLNKTLVAKDELDKITKLDGEVRQYHYTFTLPWAYEGVGLLPTELYLDYTQKMRHFREKREQIVENFCTIYPDLVEQAKDDLKDLFNALDYPDTTYIRSRFKMAIEIYPIPESKDIRLSLDSDTVNEIKKHYEDNSNSMLEKAMSNIWQRLFSVVEHMYKRLSQADAVFKKSLVDNIIDLCSILSKLNITNDTRLDQLRKEVIEHLTVHDAQALREDSKARNETAEKAKEIMNKMKGIMS